MPAVATVLNFYFKKLFRLSTVLLWELFIKSISVKLTYDQDRTEIFSLRRKNALTFTSSLWWELRCSISSLSEFSTVPPHECWKSRYKNIGSNDLMKQIKLEFKKSYCFHVPSRISKLCQQGPSCVMTALNLDNNFKSSCYPYRILSVVISQSISEILQWNYVELCSRP